MKKLVLSIALVAGLAASAFAQGTILLDNSDNNSGSSSATANGLFWINTTGNPVILNQDINISLFASSSQGGTYTAIATLLLSNHTADGDITFYGNGILNDQSGNSYFVPGTTANGTGWFYIQAWLGTATSYTGAGAVAKYDGSTTAGGIFSTALGGGSTPAKSLDGMPAVVLVVPEPGTFALAGLGAAALLIFRRRK
jgi:hypothetical protein